MKQKRPSSLFPLFTTHIARKTELPSFYSLLLMTVRYTAALLEQPSGSWFFLFL
jgi:hypothetical protein